MEPKKISKAKKEPPDEPESRSLNPEDYLKEFLLLEESVRKSEIELITKLDKELKKNNQIQDPEIKEYLETSKIRTLKYFNLITQKIFENFLERKSNQTDTCIISDLRTFYQKNSKNKSG